MSYNPDLEKCNGMECGILRNYFLSIFMCFLPFIQYFEIDPIFKFVPKSSLSSLAVQTDSEYDITMIVGNNAAANTVIRMNGPFENNNAGIKD